MMMLEDLTIRNKDKSTIEGVTYDIKSQSILLIKNSIELEKFTKSLIGKTSISGGRIYIKKNFVESNHIKGNPFFLISSDLGDYWSNFRLSEIGTLVMKNPKTTSKKNRLLTRKYFSELSPIQKLKFFLEVGESINRKIYIFENPVEKLDYKEMEEFKMFILNDLSDKNYLIIDRKLNEIYKNLQVPVYYF